ncbi:hypothetical protein HTZ77_35150 [Nonomuraea sp. SMC257]|uniref:TOMM leader peptide-binding protein n=1 Tax=Nonomuraea montanisoli TaxID=2741721 RepID=A0A7Y6IFB9_9ACTN|nr:hypothetical protein [Nonomuraea montanisoli]NUW36608.1 hypothetical protein [Nonomuraea montanisoli]
MTSTHVIAVGPFAADVATSLARREGVDASPSFFAQGTNVDTSLLRPADAYVLVTSRHDPHVLVRIGDIVRSWGAALVPVVHETRRLRCGPILRPGGTGACAACFEARSVQNWSIGESFQGLYDFYRRDAAGPEGHLSSHTLLAAGLAQWGLDAVRAGKAVHGAYRTVSLVKPQVTEGTTTGVHGCARCYPRADAGARRDASWRELSEHLARAGAPAEEDS